MERYVKRARYSGKRKSYKGGSSSGKTKWNYPPGANSRWKTINSVAPSNHLLRIQNPTVFPEHLNTSLYWNARFTMTTSNVVPYTAWALRANSLFDPDYTNSSDNDQPKYFDILCGAAQPYNYYRVNNCYAEAIVFDQHSTEYNPTTAYLIPSATVFSGTLSDSTCETARNAEKGSSALITPGSGGAVRLCCYGSTKDMVGPFNDFGSSASFYNTSPASPWYISLVLDCDQNGVANSHTFTVDLRVKYNVTFFQQPEINDS